jgi:hypothetical protein
MRSLRQPVNVEAMTSQADIPPPLLGVDTAHVLREAGCSEAEIAQLCRREAALRPEAGISCCEHNIRLLVSGCE